MLWLRARGGTLAGRARPCAGRRLDLRTSDLTWQRPVPIRTGIGIAHDAVSTKSKEAQAFYDQGLAYLHSYVWLEAARSFNQALRSTRSWRWRTSA